MRVVNLPSSPVAVLAFVFVFFAANAREAVACPYCPDPSITLSEQLAFSDAAVLVQWVSAKKPTDEKVSTLEAFDEFSRRAVDDGTADADRDEKDSNSSPSDAVGSTTYEVLRVARGEQDVVKKGDRITIVRHRPGQPGDLFLLLGTKGIVVEWSTPVEITETGFNYLVQAPPLETPAAKRLEYFIKFLEYPDPLVANDAFQEFGNSSYKDVVPLAEKLSPDEVAGWIVSEDTTPTRLAFYGMLLGICGKEEHAELLKKRVFEETDEFRLGIDGLMSGYLLLAGEEGLELLEEEKIKPHYVEYVKPDGTVERRNKVPFSETYATMGAIRFMWDYGDGRISAERLRQSMRSFLDRPDLADLVIADLARWKDWSVQDKLLAMYGAEEYDVGSVKRAIVRYFLVCAASAPKDDPNPPAHVASARKHLVDLRARDPKIVQEAERFFFIE
ncbi:MAG: hypothetical protein WD066_00925 [Planctomycetaceae bacterium]